MSGYLWLLTFLVWAGVAFLALRSVYRELTKDDWPDF